TCTNSATFTASVSGATQYTIGIVVDGFYTRNSSEDNTVIDVAQPITANFITGGGFLVNTSASNGQYPGTVDKRTNFGFNVKYNKGGTNLQGNLTDRGEPGANDSIGVTVYSKNGGLWFSSNWSGTLTLEQLLGGGNLVGH